MVYIVRFEIHNNDECSSMSNCFSLNKFRFIFRSEKVQPRPQYRDYLSLWFNEWLYTIQKINIVNSEEAVNISGRRETSIIHYTEFFCMLDRKKKNTAQALTQIRKIKFRSWIFRLLERPTISNSKSRPYATSSLSLFWWAHFCMLTDYFIATSSLNNCGVTCAPTRCFFGICYFLSSSSSSLLLLLCFLHPSSSKMNSFLNGMFKTAQKWATMRNK